MPPDSEPPSPEDRIRRPAWRPVLAGAPINTIEIAIIDLAAVPEELQLEPGVALPRQGTFRLEQNPQPPPGRLVATYSPTRLPELGSERIGRFWGRSIVRWERFVDESLDSFNSEGDPELEALFDRIGERLPDVGDKIGGWPRDSGMDAGGDGGFWLQVSAGDLSGGSPGHGLAPWPGGGEFALFGTGWAYVYYSPDPVGFRAQSTGLW